MSAVLQPPGALPDMTCQRRPLGVETVTHGFDAPPPARVCERIEEGECFGIPDTRRRVGLVGPACKAVGGAERCGAVDGVVLYAPDRGQERRQVRPRTCA